MKRTSVRALFISLVLMMALFMVLGVKGSSEISTDSVYNERDSGSFNTIKLNLPHDVMASNGSDDDFKHVTASIEDIVITPLISGKIFPNTPVDFIIETKGPTPERATLFLDRDDISLNLTYDLSSGEISTSEGLNGYVDVDRDNSSTCYNSTSKKWEIDFRLNFRWQFPKDLQKNIEATMVDIYGGWDSLIVEDAYTFEADLEVSGEPTITPSDPSALAMDGFLRGGTSILIEHISVHFQGVPQISPDPDDIITGIKDDKGRFWEYTPLDRDHLSSVSFSLPIPREEGPFEFTFKVYQTPSGSVSRGEIKFDYYLDSLSPALLDFRYKALSGILDMSWAVKEDGSGVDNESIYYSILDDGNPIIGWTPLENPDFSNGRLRIKINGLPKDDLLVRLRMSDRVGNDHPSDQTFAVSMNPVPAHDVSMELIDYSPKPVIINQIVNFHFMIYNHGSEDEIPIQMEVERNGEFETYIDIPALPAGSSREIRWNWKAMEGASEFEMVLDPQGRIDDNNIEDNSLSMLIDPEYLDITIGDDSLIVSDPQADNMDLVILSFNIKSVGSIESGPIKVMFMQDEKYLGMYQVESIKGEGSYGLDVDWKVDDSIRNLTLNIDPYNEIIESIEDNNIIHFPNPFMREEGKDGSAPGFSNEGASTEKNSSSAVTKENTEKTLGGTVWSGPEIPDEPQSDQEPFPSPVIVQPTPDEPISISPVFIPTVGFIVSSAFLGLAVFGIKNEILKLRFLGLLFPLYSKLKKNNIEKGVRYEILGYIKAKPGANYSELKRNLDLNDGSLFHHLRILEREEKIYSKRMGKFKLFYASSYRRQPSLQGYVSPFQKRLLELITLNPGIVPKELSKMLDRSQTDISYHLGELGRKGILKKGKKGRNIHYYMSDDFSDLFI